MSHQKWAEKTNSHPQGLFKTTSRVSLPNCFTRWQHIFSNSCVGSGKAIKSSALKCQGLKMVSRTSRELPSDRTVESSEGE